MEWSPLSIVFMIWLELLDGVVLEKDDEHALVHLVPHQQIKKLLHRLEDVTTVLCLPADELGLRGLHIEEPFERELF